MENKIHIAFWKEMGADATPMSWGEAYIARIFNRFYYHESGNLGITWVGIPKNFYGRNERMRHFRT